MFKRAITILIAVAMQAAMTPSLAFATCWEQFNGCRNVTVIQGYYGRFRQYCANNTWGGQQAFFQKWHRYGGSNCGSWDKSVWIALALAWGLRDVAQGINGGVPPEAGANINDCGGPGCASAPVSGAPVVNPVNQAQIDAVNARIDKDVARLETDIDSLKQHPPVPVPVAANNNSNNQMNGWLQMIMALLMGPLSQAGQANCVRSGGWPSLFLGGGNGGFGGFGGFGSGLGGFGGYGGCPGFGGGGLHYMGTIGHMGIGGVGGARGISMAGGPVIRPVPVGASWSGGASFYNNTYSTNFGGSHPTVLPYPGQGGGSIMPYPNINPILPYAQ